MEEKHLNKTKVIINVIAIIVIIALIVLLTRYMTNRKEAVYISSEGNNVSTNIAENISESNVTNNLQSSVENTSVENIWEVKKSVEQSNIKNVVNTQEQSKSNTSTKNETKNNSTTQNETKSNTATQNKTKNNTTSENTDNKSNKGIIYLTFDDGPSSNITPKILDILKKENIKATFFVINYSEANEHLVKRAVEEGHTIGIHGYSHEYSKIYKSKDSFMDNVYSLQNKIQKTTGVKTWYTRFPGGSSNTVSRKYCKGIMTQLTKEMLAKGFKYYDWNVSSGDAGGAKTAKDVYNNVIKNLSKKRGNMVLMHDFSGNKKGLEALPNIIKYAKKEGYTFAPIDDNTPMYAQKVNN